MKKLILKKIISALVIICVGYVLQSSLFSRLQLAGVTPNILLLVTVSLGLLQGSLSGMLVGALCGFICDVDTGSYLGLHFLLYLYIGYLSGVVKRWFYGEDLKLPIFLIGLMDLIYGLVVYAGAFLVRQRYDFEFYFQNVIVPEAVYTMLVAILLYFVIFRVNRWIEQSAQRGGKDIV